jgi:phage repressor protein C with HTH and peptisase S24 domain
MKRRELTAEEVGEAERLKAAWEGYRAQHDGATQTWLAAESGLGTQGAVSQYLRGVIPLNLQALLAISRVVEADPRVISPRLMEVVHQATEKADTQTADPLRALRPGSFMRVDGADQDDPRLTIIPKVRLRLTAGLSGFEVEPEPYDGSSTTVPTDWIDRNGYSRDKLIAITVRGESMEPTFYEGDLVVINTADTAPVAGAVYAVNYEGEPAIKRLARDAGRWWLVSDNVDQRRYYRQSFEGDTSQIIGRVVRKETERF